jgi:diguanylate cyclase (GGDEF)-like protein/PAS domain S-box-containing protein
MRKQKKVEMTEDVSASVRDKDLRFRLIVDSIQDYAIYMLDLQGRVTTWNSGAERNKGYTSSEILGQHFSRFFLPEDIAAGLPDRLLAEAAANGHLEAEGWRVRKNGSRFWASVAISTMHAGDGQLIGYAKVTRDLTERKRHEETLLASEAALGEEKERMHVTLYSIADGVVCTDEAGNITLMNPAAEDMTGWIQDQAYGRPLEEILHLVDLASGVTVENPIRNCLIEKKTIHLQDGAALFARDGSKRDIQDSAAPIRTADGNVVGAVLVFQDVTRLRTIQREFEFNATHDALTLLPNRRELEIRLEETIRRAVVTGVDSTVCFLNLDRFKVINDTAGHAAGDMLLKTVGHLLAKNVRGSDMVVRLGGDQFAVVLFGCDEDRAEGTLTKIREGIEALHFRWEDREFRISASIGVVAITPVSNVPTIMQQADVACYAAKRAGGNRISVYRPGLNDGHERHLELQAAANIRDAISEDRFTLFAQKIMSTGEAQIPRYEILLRMIGRDGGIVLPAHFIPAAERFDLMADVDRWVLKRVLHYHAEQLLAIPGVQLCINLSGNSLNDATFLPFLLDALKHSLLPPTALTLEITETSLIKNLSRAGVIIEQLRSVGCKIALDDFGIGLSSFSYLRNFKVDFIKIDGSFVRDITHNAIDFAIVKAINNIAHEIHSQTVAEFVEDESTMTMVRELGVDFAQGYGLGRPKPIEEIFVRAARDSGPCSHGSHLDDAAPFQAPSFPGAPMPTPSELTASDSG